MVVHRYSKLFTSIGNVASHRDILPTACAVAAGMDVHKHDSGCAKVHCPADNLACVDGGLVNRSFPRHLIPDQHVFAVEIKRAHAFNRQMRHVRAQIIEQ